MSKALIPIDVIASNLSAGIGDSTNRFKFTFLRHLLSGWRELNLYVGQDTEIKTAVLEVDNVISLPCDFVYETKVGILHNNCLAVLSLDKSIKPQCETQEESTHQVADIFAGVFAGDVYPFYNCFRGGDFLGELYGYGRGVHCAGYYNIDKKNGEIYIGSLVPEGAEIVIEYKADGISNGLKLVPTEMEMCLSYWAKARFYEERKDYTSATYNQREYERAYNKVKRLYNFKSALYMAAEINSFFSPSNY